MNNKLIPVAFITMAMLSACQTHSEPKTTDEQPASMDSCRAVEFNHLIGKPETVLDSMKFAGPVRLIKPGQAVTMDHNPERINFIADEKGIITRVSCS
ncbi:I78 family peptidase inhibitor [Biostraticola tofi]|uniref:Peptidase inhibitor I78 family protein n=1 Tax=Biostraticola tofi TaxID=466109 RepID=A0A4R3Z2Z8_9GAMM|nr:I78 family peptidase inhibitor [Biostraticola tofi]TCV98213.1 peptidase inhibitor I78 family protein [Biostraticola tofi]